MYLLYSFLEFLWTEGRKTQCDSEIHIIAVTTSLLLRQLTPSYVFFRVSMSVNGCKGYLHKMSKSLIFAGNTSDQWDCLMII